MSTTQTQTSFPGLPRSATLAQVIDWLNGLRLQLSSVLNHPQPATNLSYVANTSEALSAGNFTNTYSNSGTLNVRKAVASDPTKFANGYVLADYGSGIAATVFFGGINSAVTVSAPLGDVYLDDSTSGGYTTTIPTTTGHIVQQIGTAFPGVGIAFHEGVTVEL